MGHQHKLWQRPINGEDFFMQLKLSYQLKIDSYTHKMYYEILILTTTQNPIIDTKMINRKNNQSKPLQNNINFQRKTDKEIKEL